MGFKPFKNIVKNLATPFLNNAINKSQIKKLIL